jgi:anti-sigma regulatory factor (Ser/Thr protein kinase)
MAHTEVLRLELPYVFQAPRVARNAVREAVIGLPLPTPQEDIDLVISELVTNAVVHGAPPIELIVLVGRGALRIEVCDGLAMSPVIPTDAADRLELGCGLTIVDNLTDRWGWLIRPPGKCIWAACGVTTN